MRAGKLNRRGKIRARSGTLDALGQQVDTWSDVLTVWCSVNPLSGRQLELAQQRHAEVTFEVVVRYSALIVPSQRFEMGARIFDILYILDPSDAHVSLRLYCSEGVSNG